MRWFHDLITFRIDLQLKYVMQKIDHRRTNTFKPPSISFHYYKIIAISDISLYLECVFYKSIEFIHINIRENLTREIANGHTNFFSRNSRVAADYLFQKTKCYAILDAK